MLSASSAATVMASGYQTPVETAAFLTGKAVSEKIKKDLILAKKFAVEVVIHIYHHLHCIVLSISRRPHFTNSPNRARINNNLINSRALC